MQPEAFDLARVYRTEIATFVVGYAFAEIVWLRVRHGRQHPMPELLSNLFIYVVDTCLRLLTWPARLAFFVLVHEASPLRIPTTVPAAVACYLAVDFILYWYHRVLHQTELGWALHSVHHTGRDYNVSLGVRLSWPLRAFDDVVYLPLPALGFDPLLVLAMAVFNRFSQYWLHTEMIGRLPLLDPWLNTPSNHRMHHAATTGMARANYGSNFVFWDRWFGTYCPEQGPSRYGTDDAALGSNPFTVQFAGVCAYVRRRLAR